jgi:hypothetical protein
MRMICITIFLFTGLVCFSQQVPAANYLLIRVDNNYDYTMERSFYSIKAESGCEGANEIYSLMKYDFKKNAVNDKASFYYNVLANTSNIYNYFLSTTELLNYLSKNGWTLFSVYSETFSGYDNQRTGNGEIVPVTTISSRPVFCFKK